MKKKAEAVIISQKEISGGIFDLELQTELACEAHAGQFVGVYTSDASKLLPRPISICRAEKDTLRLVYRVTGAGTGTEALSRLKSGDRVDILGILGNGYDLSRADGVNVVLMGGGIGIPPMLELAGELKARGKYASMTVILGYRDSNLFLEDDFNALTGDKEKLYIVTEDGSTGFKGNVLNAMDELKDGVKADVYMACGPMPMLRAIAFYAREKGAKAYISLEERMACGVGACLGCITRTKNTDEHSHVNNARICTDGPVFDAEELEL